MDGLLWTLVLCCAAVAADPADAFTKTSPTSYPIGMESLFSDGTESTFTDGTELTFTDGTEVTNTDGTEETVTDGTESTFTDGTELTFTDGTEVTNTDGTEETVTDGTELTFTDGTELTFTDGTEVTNTDGTEESVTDDTPNEIRHDAPNEIRHGTPNGVRYASVTICTADEFPCHSLRSSSGCIPLRWVCDGDVNDCYDSSDERNCGSSRSCPTGYFACPLGRCIPNSWKCDGTNDCLDGSGTDELNCTHCPENTFACRSPRRDSGCIPTSWMCDGDHGDCYDGSDEQNCGTSTPSSTSDVSPANCPVGQFACRSPRRSSGCIPRNWVCDGDHGDCYDGSDERNCGQRGCASNEFACTSNRRSSGCIPRTSVCDGDHGDCVDGSDERQCGTGSTSSTTEASTAAHTCSPDEFACRSPRRANGCIPRSWVCDGDRGDCFDHSDESNCGTNSEPTPGSMTSTTDNPAVNTAVPQTPTQGGAVKVELPSWLATDQDTHFSLSLAPMLRARAPRDKLDAQMAVLRLFRDLARN